jgi:hypothetical protein
LALFEIGEKTMVYRFQAASSPARHFQFTAVRSAGPGHELVTQRQRQGTAGKAKAATARSDRRLDDGMSIEVGLRPTLRPDRRC